MYYKEITIKTIQEKYPVMLLGVMTFFLLSFSLYKVAGKTFSSFSMMTQITQKKQLKPTKYTVKEGDDLWAIAEKHYGSGYNAFDIAAANKLKEPYILEKGQVLMIPVVTPKKPTKGEITDKAFTSTQIKSVATSYTVKEGDYVFKIAEEMYGDGNAMMRIIEANNIPYPFDIQAGTKLIIPR